MSSIQIDGQDENFLSKAVYDKHINPISEALGEQALRIMLLPRDNLPDLTFSDFDLNSVSDFLYWLCLIQ
jgi:hypothetical protein